jgi:hypothetical protein
MKLVGLERLRRGAIPPHGCQVDQDASVGAEAQAILGDRRVGEMAAELFEASETSVTSPPALTPKRNSTASAWATRS